MHICPISHMGKVRHRDLYLVRDLRARETRKHYVGQGCPLKDKDCAITNLTSAPQAHLSSTRLGRRVSTWWSYPLG